MIWSKKLVAIYCFFTTVFENRKIRLTAYRNQGEDYMVGDIAVSYLPLCTQSIVSVVLSNKGNPKWKNAIVIESDEIA